MKVYFVERFPAARLESFGEEGWVHNPNHIRNRYNYLEAIIEDINNSFCEPIHVQIRQGQVTAGPHGANRLWALKTHQGDNFVEFPAIVATDKMPTCLDHCPRKEITTLAELAVHYKRDILDPTVATVDFTNGFHFNTWGSFSPLHIYNTFKASADTTDRVAELFAVEHMLNGTFKDTWRLQTSEYLMNKWTAAFERERNRGTNI